MVRITDEKFVTTLYRRFCGRSVSGRLSRLTLQARRIQVEERYVPMRFDARSRIVDVTVRALVLSVLDGERSLLDIGWHRNRAWAMRVITLDQAVLEADQPEFSTFVRRFLLKHGVIDRQGKSRLEGVA